MPKVTTKYLTDRKDFILECTNEVLKEKPLYQITMRDIIKKAGFSQGAIYRYYANIDEIYIDLINKNTTYDLLEQKIDDLLNSKQPEKIILFHCINAIGTYVSELLKTVGGIINYITKKIELGVLHSTIPIASMNMFISVSIDGIAQTVAMSTVENNSEDMKLSIDINEMFQLLATAIINFFED